VIFFHGLGSSCHKDEQGAEFQVMRDYNPYKNPLYCVEYGAYINGALKSINYLAKRACRELERNEGKFNLQAGFLVYGSSQGGIISRYII
jgi:Palmitoyl protein thioesterase